MDTGRRHTGTYDHLPLPYQSLDEQGVIIDVNRCWCNTLGYTRDEVIGTWFGDLLPSKQRPKFKQMFPLFKEQGYIRGCKLQLHTKDNGIIHASFNGTIAYHDDGSIAQTHCMFEDVTLQKQTMEQLRRHTENMEYIAGTAKTFMELEAGEQIYDYIGRCIQQHVKNCTVIVNSYDMESGMSRIEAIVGITKKLETICDILGRHPVGMEFPVVGEDKEEMLSGRLMVGPSGLHELSAGTIPRPVAALLDRLMGVNEIYGMGFAKAGELYGNVVIITTSDEARVEPEVLETLIGQASIWLQRHQAMQALVKSEEKYRTLFENMAQGVFYQRRDGSFVDVNQAALDMFGLTRSEFLNRDPTNPDWHVLAEDGTELSPVERPSEMALATGRPVRDATVGIYNTDEGSYRWMEVNAIPQFMDGADRPSQVFVTMQDITSRKRAHEALAASEQELQLTLDATTDGIWTWNFKTDEMSFSPRYYTMLGYQPGAFEASFENWLSLIHPEDREQALQTAKEYMETKPDHYENEFRLRTRNGDYRWIRSHARVVERDDDGAAVRMIGNHEDITKRKQALLELQNSLEEKKVLLREIHHRVKNNLQIISSMLSMEAMQRENPEARRALQDMQLRIKSMGFVHEHLYETTDLSQVDVHDYLSKLAHNVMQTHDQENVTFTSDIQDMQLPLDRAIPCGLIATELLSNAFQHAYPDGQEGTIHLSAHYHDGRCILQVSDDGVGIPEDVDNDTLGLQLVDMLTAQLDGSIEFTGQEGTTAILRFASPDAEVTA